ncbi:MAG TPA: hypothetical protein VMK65_13680 [Longimicrobiales bacterium]|nr:hypothetical protein [Longimicrobiales bacterium]
MDIVMAIVAAGLLGGGPAPGVAVIGSERFESAARWAEAVAQKPGSPPGKAEKAGGPDRKGGPAADQEKARGQRPDQAKGRGQAAGQEKARGQGADQEKARGQDRGQGPGQRPPGARGEGVRGEPGQPDRGRPGVRASRRVDLSPRLRELMGEERTAGRAVAVALGRSRARGADAERLELRRLDDRVQVRGPDGRLLLDLDDARARGMGGWTVARVAERDTEGSPSFCRSGEGHPVWGREWCARKGFGLGGATWGRTRVEDVILRQPRERTGVTLRDVLDGVILDRLALHALSLGYTDPLYGYWLGEPTGPRVLRIEAGGQPVAELVDDDRDGRVDVILVSLD